jgi:HEAT repeat protein
MGAPSEFPQGASSQPGQTPGVDPRLQPTPDYGTLGAGSDVANFGPTASEAPARKTPPRLVQLFAASIGMLAAIVAGTMTQSHKGVRRTANSSQTSVSTFAGSSGSIDGMRSQKEAETLLEQAVGHSPGAIEQISSRVDRWKGEVQWTPQIANLTTAALNSNDMRVRESGVEVELAAYGLSKNTQSLEYLLKTADSPDHGQKIWALWALGLMANRAVETERVVAVLTSHLQDADVESRRWAVEAMALSGSDVAIDTLLKAMHNDASPEVRERAACGIASSGLFTAEQRMRAVPQLLNYTDDSTVDAQTHAWAFHALTDITHQRLPNDAAAWRNWYDSTKN